MDLLSLAVGIGSIIIIIFVPIPLLFSAAFFGYYRKHIISKGIVHMGKETKNLEYSGILDRPESPVIENEKEIHGSIKKMTLKEAEKRGIPKRTFYWHKSVLNKDKGVRFRTKTKKRLIS